MSARHYRPLPGVAASLSLLATLLATGLTAGCGSDRTANLDPVTGAPPPQPAARAASADDTEETLWSVLGLAKRESERNVGPLTGNGVSPVLWQATQETLRFAGISSEDPMTGLYVTEWYAPRGKPGERLRVSVFITSRALRSDSLAVNVERQERGPGGGWRDAPVARDVVAGLETAILQRARQIRALSYRNTM